MVLSNSKKLLLAAWAAFLLTSCGGGSSPKTDATSPNSTTAMAVTLAEAEAVSWVRCATEYQTCTFSGTAQVRYGLNGTYVYKTATESIGCNNTAFGSDPVYGATKACDYLLSTTLPPDSWTYCATENQTCTFTGTAQVRYGLNGVYVYKTAADSIACNNTTFGNDPVYGKTKVCEYLPTSSIPSGPSAVADSYSVQSGQSLSIAAPGLLSNDAPGSGGALTVAGSSQATHGSVTVNPNGSFTYVPAAGYVGSDSFTYIIRDAAGQESTATVSLTVAGVPPGGTWTYCSMEYQTCAFSGTAQVRYGLNGVYVYKTATGSIGCNNMAFGDDPVYGATKMCEYQPVTTPPALPVAGNDSYSVQSGQSLSVAVPGVLSNDTPGSGTSMTVASATAAAHGTVSVNPNGSFTYAPASGYVGPDSFTYTLQNNLGQEHNANVSITVTASGSGGISSYLDLAGTTIAKYRDNKQAAASYTFDDGNASSPAIAAVFESAGVRATFYINPGIMPLDWSVWRQIAQKGHEVGNHTMNHRKLIDQWQHSAETLDYEINQAQIAIEQNVGVKPLTFAFPYNEYSPSSLAVVMQNHIATRVPGFEADPGFRRLNVMSSSSAASANEHLSGVMSMGGWFCLAGHGMDGDGWEPVTTQYLRDHLTYAVSQAERLWVDTYVNVARYRLCREKAVPEVALVNDRVASLKMGGSYPASLCTEPLTMAIPMWQATAVQATTASGATVPMVQSNGRLLINLVPGQEVLLQVP